MRLGQVSTDSLDVSAIDGEHLRAVCRADARDYCLTFGSKMADSTLIAPTVDDLAAARRDIAPPAVAPRQTQVDHYRDAPLSTGVDDLTAGAASPSSSSRGEEQLSADNLVTWGRIRRSCGSSASNNAGTALSNFANGNTVVDNGPKSFSVPNLGFNHGFYNHLIGAGEQMVGGRRYSLRHCCTLLRLCADVGSAIEVQRLG